jgi:hydroxyacylglutathione hydrolase
VGYELRTNPSIRAAVDQQHFVDFILVGQPEPPLYFARMKRDNRRGPALLQSLPSPPALSASDLAALEDRSDLVVLDTRPRRAFFDGHLGGSLSAELDQQFCAIAGSFVPEDMPVYLLVDDSRLDEAVRALIRIGLDRIAGHIAPEELAAFKRQRGGLRRTATIDMAGLEAGRVEGRGHVLDVRGLAEFDAGHVPGALHVPHTRIGVAVNRLPADKPLLVHCSSGARAAAAVALLTRLGFTAIAVDDQFANYRCPQRVVTSEGRKDARAGS